eukprot:COSAG04_NODE_7852_length_1056_cov_1.724138_2_plen_158_part_00
MSGATPRRPLSAKPSNTRRPSPSGTAVACAKQTAPPANQSDPHTDAGAKPTPTTPASTSDADPGRPPPGTPSASATTATPVSAGGLPGAVCSIAVDAVLLQKHRDDVGTDAAVHSNLSWMGAYTSKGAQGDITSFYRAQVGPYPRFDLVPPLVTSAR